MGVGETSSAALTPAPTRADAPARLAAAAPKGVAPAMAPDGLSLGAGAGWVKVRGSQLVDQSGQPFALRGINLGGWLVQEPWMMPLAPAGKGEAPIPDQATLWDTVARRFGTDQMNQLRDAYRGNWLADADFARIAASGLNTVRLPFTYANLQEPDGYKWLDWAVDEAGKHGLKVILDLHGAPGGQSAAMHTGQANQNQFFKDPKDVQAAAKLWQDVARRYANRPEVLGFDLLNEPMGAASAKQLGYVQNQLYQAIRQVDTRHVIFLEDGYKGLETLPRPQQYGWQNVAYSIHQYDFKARTPQDQLNALDRTVRQVERVREARNVPVYVGEFNLPGADEATLGKAVAALDGAGVPWTMWTYKVMTPGSQANGIWGLYRNTQASQTLDVRHDSLEVLYDKVSGLRTENLAAVPGEVTMLQHRTPARASRVPRWQRVLWRAEDRIASLVAGLVDGVRGLWPGNRGRTR